MDAKPFPLDVERYKRGDIVTVTELERASGLSADRHPEKLAFFTLSAVKQLKDHFLNRGEGFVSVVVRKGAIHILRDGQDQLEYTRRGKQRARSMFLRRHLEQGSVNPSLLSGEEQLRWRREMQRDSTLLALEAPKRKLPKLRSDELLE